MRATSFRRRGGLNGHPSTRWLTSSDRQVVRVEPKPVEDGEVRCPVCHAGVRLVNRQCWQSMREFPARVIGSHKEGNRVDVKGRNRHDLPKCPGAYQAPA